MKHVTYRLTELNKGIRKVLSQYKHVFIGIGIVMFLRLFGLIGILVAMAVAWLWEKYK